LNATAQGQIVLLSGPTDAFLFERNPFVPNTINQGLITYTPEVTPVKLIQVQKKIVLSTCVRLYIYRELWCKIDH